MKGEALGVVQTSTGKYPQFNKSTSKGCQLKWVKGNKFYKGDTQGYESIAEAFVSEFESYIKDLYYVDYYLGYKTINGKKVRVCWSYNFLDKGEIEISFYNLLDMLGELESVNKYRGIDLLDAIEYVIYKHTELNVHNYLSKVIFLDSLILNSDRHLNNLSIIRTGGGSFRESPVFDNGLSLLSDCLLTAPTKVLMEHVESRPFYTSFDMQIKCFKDCSPLKIDIESFYDRVDLLLKNIDTVISTNKIEKGYFRRMVEVLKRRLKEQEGITWVKER